MGRLRATFNSLGRLNDSYPVAYSLVKDYLKFFRQEQAGFAITPVKAVPLFFDKFRRFIAFLREECVSQASLSHANKYILAPEFTLTENIRLGSPRSFALIKFTHPEVCPVACVQYYIVVCQCLEISLDQGYFF